MRPRSAIAGACYARRGGAAAIGLSWKVLQFYLDEARPLLREYAAAIGADVAAVEAAGLEVVRRHPLL